MLNKTKILEELQKKLPDIFITTKKAKGIIRLLWDFIKEKNLSYELLKEISNKQMLPRWSDPIMTFKYISPAQEYTCVGIDGSQIYPDRHQGISCYLLNIGICQITYGLQQSKVILKSEPVLNILTKDDKTSSMSNLIDAKREELEFNVALQIAKNYKEIPKDNLLFLFDGSLIFGHLENMEDISKQKFINSYLSIFREFYENKLLMASYISLPKSKDLISIFSNALTLYNDLGYGNTLNSQDLDYVSDSDIGAHALSPRARTILFEYQGSLAQYYPSYLKPYFFYMHVNKEIARIEIPAWIAQDSKYLEKIESIIFDQTIKGDGYPVVLSEAHEQAVIKSCDRQLFFDALYKMTQNYTHDYIFSQKSLKKRKINI